MRGDGPSNSVAAIWRGMCSPHARGWTADGPAGALERDVFPACAGMDRRDHWTCTCRRSVPRMRGDGPAPWHPCGRALPCSPHARGWTGIRAGDLGVDRVFPACAGMDRRIQAMISASIRVPRMRGDGPSNERGYRDDHSCSPHARGWTVEPELQRARNGVFPACAGMDRRSRPCTMLGCCVPRMRGDGPTSDLVSQGARLCSPHARGWTVDAAWENLRETVFPACAGMDRAVRTCWFR